MIATQTEVEVIDGDNAGRRGRVVSVPWLWNLWHTWVTINVACDHPAPGWEYPAREWIDERASNVIVLPTCVRNPVPGRLCVPPGPHDRARGATGCIWCGKEIT